MKNKYIPTAAGLYLNYLIHGMGVLLITLNMAHLQEQWEQTLLAYPSLSPR